MDEQKKPAMGAVQDPGQEQQPKEDPVEALNKLIKTPLAKEDAEKMYADIDVKRAQLSIVRMKWTAQLNQIQLQIASLDEQMYALELDRAVAFRRTLNPAEAK